MNYNQHHNKILNEGLRYGDLENYVSELFTIDQYKSKMGEDEDVVVIGFRVKDKFPALDLVEFLEKGYEFVLDADMSSGEEYDGQYQVFVEIERTPKLVKQLTEIINGLKHLTKTQNWKFRYQRDSSSQDFNENTLKSNVPMTKEDYKKKLIEIKTADLREFFNQGAVGMTLNEHNDLTFKKPFAGDIKTKFIAIGDYEAIKKLIPGSLNLSETAQSQVLFLNKFLGNYDINKIGDKFLIRNDKQAVIIEKRIW